MAVLISVRGQLSSNYGGAALHFDEERNRSNVQKRFHGVFLTCASRYAFGPLLSGRRLHALPSVLAKPIVDSGRGRLVPARRADLDSALVHSQPVRVS